MNKIDWFKKMPCGLGAAIKEIFEICAFLKLEAFIVGGAVRDMLLNDDILDMDITVIGNTKQLFEKLSSIYGDNAVIYPDFGTLSIKTNSLWNIDIVSARREIYAAPGALPEVCPSDLYDDLGRRDFTVNSMAVSLNTDVLIDYYGGIRDLHKGVIRIIHDRSFIDDPTRILRGIRFAKRYGFLIEDRTKALMEASIGEGYPTELSNERILKELECILSELRFIKMLRCVEDLGLWQLFFPGHTISPSAYEKLFKIKEHGKDEIKFKILVLMEDLEDYDVKRIFNPHRALYDNLKTYRRREKTIKPDIDKGALGPGELYRVFSGLGDGVLEYLKVTAGTKEYRENISEYIGRVKDFKFYIKGGDLKGLGVKPGPRYRYLLERARIKIVERNVSDRIGQLDILKGVVKRGL